MMITDRLRQIRAISFDGDMTLWDFEKIMRHSLGCTLAELRKCFQSEASAKLTVDDMIEIRERVGAELKGKTLNLEEIRLRSFECTLAHVGSDDSDLADHLYAVYMKHRYEDLELYPDVMPLLKALGSRYRLGLVSNGNSHPDRCGLSGHFSFVIFAQDVGYEKPDARIFHAACAQAGCAPRELIHIGDSLETDVHGAVGVGALSVWLNRDGKPRQSEIIPDIEIQSLDELLPMLGCQA
jgi:putative hydrolase of the HAD superfamily